MDPIGDYIRNIRREVEKDEQTKTISSLNFLQLNCHRSLTPSINLASLLNQSTSTRIGLIQEPYVNNNILLLPTIYFMTNNLVSVSHIQHAMQ